MVVILTGKNLGERHREINKKVAEIISNKSSFNDIKIEQDLSDVDKLYKIDIASHYKDVDFIVNTLKSGDSLYISRALKCLWLYNDSYSNVINTEYLHINIFPFMSIKMKKKMLSTISLHVHSKEQAASFFIYCKNNKMPNMALKFLNFSSDEFKLNVLNNESSFNLLSYLDTPRKVQNFVANSFVVAITYIEKLEIFGFWRYKNIFLDLKYLYAINNDRYMAILEKYLGNNLDKSYLLGRLGIRISRDIMLKHKNRVLENPKLYVNILNKSMLAKYSSICDAKKYISSLMPPLVKEFWEIRFGTTYSYIFELIPKNERFQYLKQLFVTTYPNEAFEMTLNFYNLNYYNMMTDEQRELWALKHINDQKEILGSGNDYMWYKFVNVDKALLEIKKYIFITPDSQKRSDIVNVLVESARDQNDLIKVLMYYNDRHMNENEEYKESFIDKVLSVHNVFEFNIECWEALNNILYSLKIYTAGRYVHNKVFMSVAVACHILHHKDMPQALIDFVDLDINYTYFRLLLDKLGTEKSELVFQYILKLFVDKLQPYEQDPHNKNLIKKFKKYVNNIHNLLNCFQKATEDCPEIVIKFMNIYSPKPNERKMITAEEILRYIKTDVSLAVDLLSHFELNINDWPERLNSALRKLKVYFQNDAAQEYIKFFERWIANVSDDYNGHKFISSAVFALFQLSDEKFKVTLMEKYQPTDTKINHSVIDGKLLCVQEAICKFVGYSRPPVPLKNVLQYIAGDYVKYCLPMFNMYLANLPSPLAMEFTKAILNMPISVQKHGLRLAFNCYTNESLKELLLNTWKRTKNVSVRMIIYKSLFEKIKNAGDDEENAIGEMYEALILFTSDLHQDDDEEIFKLITSCLLPDTFLDLYLRTAWVMVSKFPNKSVNIIRRNDIIRSIEKKINVVNKDFVHKHIIEKHVHEMLQERKLRPAEQLQLADLWNTKWELTATYIVRHRNSEEMEDCLALLCDILKTCVQMWHERYEGSRIFRKFCFDFINNLELKSLAPWLENPTHSNSLTIFKRILEVLQETLPLTEIYLNIWDLKLSIFSRLSIMQYDRGETLESLPPEKFQIISDTFAMHIGTYLEELQLKNQLYTVFLPNIAALINNKLQNFDVTLGHNFESQICFCESLANIGMKETFLLTLMIMPVNNMPQDKSNEIIKKIQAFQDEEVQSYLFKLHGDKL